MPSIPAFDCVKWAPGGRNWGHCADNLFGGRPSLGTCNNCKARVLRTPGDPVAAPTPAAETPKPAIAPIVSPPPTIAHKVTHGLIGMAKAVTGIGRADDATISARRAICLGCEFRRSVVGGVVQTCGKCGCALAAKTVNESEHCPLPVPKW